MTRVLKNTFTRADHSDARLFVLMVLGVSTVFGMIILIKALNRSKHIK